MTPGPVNQIKWKRFEPHCPLLNHLLCFTDLLYCANKYAYNPIVVHTHYIICTRVSKVINAPLATPASGYNRCNLHSSLDKRVVSLERRIVVERTGIYLKAKVLCEQCFFLILAFPFIHFDSLCFAYGSLSWVEPLLLYHAGALRPSSSRWKKMPLSQLSTAPLRLHHPHIFHLICALHGPCVVLLPGSLHL